MVLFFTSMFSTVSIYRLPCKTISGLWFGLPAIGRARPVLCHTSREGVVSEGGAHGERVLRSDRPPGNAAPHHAAARAQMQPVSRSSRRWPRAPSSMPPSSPEEHLSPAPRPVPTLWLQLPPFPPRLCLHGECPKVQPVHKGRDGIFSAHLCS